MNFWQRLQLNKLMKKWDKGSLSAKEFVQEMESKGLTWEDVQALQMDESPQVGHTEATGGGGSNRLALAAFILALLVLLALLGLGWQMNRNIGKQGEALDSAIATTTASLRKADMAQRQTATRISAVETAVAPEPVVVDRIEGISIPATIVVGDDPLELHFRVQGENVEGKTIEFVIKPSNLASLVQPHSGIVVGGKAVLVLDPRETGTLTITPKYEEHSYDPTTVTIMPRLQSDFSIEPMQIIAGKPEHIVFTVGNNTSISIDNLSIICEQPAPPLVKGDMQDFRDANGKLRSDIDFISPGGKISRNMVLNSTESFSLHCYVVDERGRQYAEMATQINVVALIPNDIRLSPTEISDITIEMTNTITATVLDQMGTPMSGITITWHTEPQELGSFTADNTVTDEAGNTQTIFVASGSGQGDIIATTPLVEGKPISKTIPVIVRPVAIIKQSDTPIRKGPGTIYPEITRAEKDETFMILGQYQKWFQVVKEDQSLSGWVKSSKARVHGNENDIPLIDSPPPNIWMLQSGDAFAQVKLFDEAGNEIGHMPDGRELKVLNQKGNRMSAQVELWVESQFVVADQLSFDFNSIKACWDLPVPSTDSCGDLTHQANGTQVTIKTETEQDGWVLVSFTAWINKEELEWAGQ